MFRFAIFAWYFIEMFRKLLFFTAMLYVLIYIQSVGPCACGSDFYIYLVLFSMQIPNIFYLS